MTAAADLFMAFSVYMASFAKDPDGFSKSGLLEPPENVMDEIAAEEWRRVAPKLYEMDRLWPREIIGLHLYCTNFSHWQRLKEKSESMPELQPYVDRVHAQLKQAARGFGFFLDENGRMNLDQPLPLIAKKQKRRNANV